MPLMPLLSVVPTLALALALAPPGIAGQPDQAHAEEAMPKEIWINLPVKDVDRARDFFAAIGFKPNPKFGDAPNAASFVVGDKGVVVMLFGEETFSGFAASPIADPGAGTEVLLSIGLDSREAVDALAERVAAAGGTVFGGPAESQGWMYGMGFVDLDGHRWNALYMDMSLMPQQ